MTQEKKKEEREKGKSTNQPSDFDFYVSPAGKKKERRSYATTFVRRFNLIGFTRRESVTPGTHSTRVTNTLKTLITKSFAENAKDKNEREKKRQGDVMYSVHVIDGERR